MDKARLERPVLPVIVLAKVQIRSKTWPDHNGVSADGTAARDREILRAFIQKENYRRVWENDVFQVLIPPPGQDIRQAARPAK
jgi:hypothetical protein